ncbi:MAG TPA: hypothetical protein VLL97_05705 [Acidobacteriota bacterium]|nr:hypothetical protein [Acidobacteriota bacterium]
MIDKKNLIMVGVLMFLLAAIPITALAESNSGSGRFDVSRTLLAAGTEIPQGQYDVRWTSTGADASVVFAPRGRSGASIEVKGKIERGARNNDFNSLSMGKDADGRDIIRHLQFRGTNIRIVF